MVRIRAPELPQDFPWLNVDRPLSLKALRGRVVLLDFWTYGCINCLHVLPDLKYLEQKYGDRLMVIGIHSAKFAQEQTFDSVHQAILRYDITHPVLLDRQFHVWQHYTIRAWPTFVVIDPQGYIVDTVSGEGKRAVLDELINQIVQVQSHAELLSEQPLDLNLGHHRSLPTRLAFPGKVLADVASDRLFIADSGHHRLVVATLKGQVLQVIGTGMAGLKDGDFTEAQFSHPQGMAFDRERSRLYVADTDNHVIRTVDLVAETVTTIAGTGEQRRSVHPDSGQALETALNSPWDVTQVAHFLFIAMAGSHQIWALDLQDGLIGTYAGTGGEACVDGSLDEATFAQPSGITTDGEDLFIADSEGSTIRAIGLGKEAIVRTICGSGDLFSFGDVDGQGEAVRLQHCLGVAYAPPHHLWIADTYNHKIKQVDLKTALCYTVLGNGTAGLQEGQGQDAQFYEPSGLSVAESSLYVADTNNHAIRHVDLTTLTVTTLSLPELCAPDACFPD